MVYCIFLLVVFLCYVVGIRLTYEYLTIMLLDVSWIHGTFNAFFLRLGVSSAFFSSFTMILSLFSRKCVQNKKAESNLDQCRGDPRRSLTARHSFQRTVDGDRRLKVQASGETQGNLSKCGATEGSTVRRLIDGPYC